MKSHKLVFIVVLLSRTAFAQTLQDLNSSYEHYSINNYVDFLDKWANTRNSKIQNENIKVSSIAQEIKNVLNVFYNKKYYGLKLNKADKIELDYQKYKTNYWVINPELEVNIVSNISNELIMEGCKDSLEKTSIILSEKIIEIDIHIKNCKILYLTKKHKEIIKEFLKGDLDSYGNITRGGSFLGRCLQEERVKFLNQKLHIEPTHWGGSWIIQNKPIINKIIFNEKMTRAVLRYEIFNSYGEAYFIKKFNKWFLIKSKLYARQ